MMLLGERLIQMHENKGKNQVQLPGPNQAGSVGIDIQINNVVNNQPNGDLPGAGHLGFINLTLSNRVHEQLKEPASERTRRFLDTIEMLSAKEVPEILTIDAEVEKEKDSD